MKGRVLVSTNARAQAGRHLAIMHTAHSKQLDTRDTKPANSKTKQKVCRWGDGEEVRMNLNDARGADSGA